MIGNSTTAVDVFKTNRLTLGLSQSKLARLCHVSRFKICMFELGSGSLRQEELDRVLSVLQTEAMRLRNVGAALQLNWFDRNSDNFRPESDPDGGRDER